MTLEVVIASYERPLPLRRTLDALAQQTVQDFRVAVVDDCSRTPIASWLEAGSYPYALRLLRTPGNSGPAVARNLAVSSSEAGLICFIDDDVVPDRGALKAHLAVLETHGPRTVSIGPLRAPADWKPTPWNRWEAESLRVEYERMQNGEYDATWRQFFTGNAMLHREAFLSVGGFDARFKRAEDIEFAYRLALRGARFIFEPCAIGWHYAERSLESWRRMAFQYAEFDSAIDQLHPELRWRDVMAREQRQRHPLTRVVGRSVAALGIEQPAASASVSAARLADFARFHAFSRRLLSLSFQLEYGRGLRSVDARQRFNPPSTNIA